MPKKTADSMVKKEVVEKTVTNKGKKGKGAADVPTSVTAGKGTASKSSGPPKLEAQPESPFPKHESPDSAAVAQAVRGLAQLHGTPKRSSPEDRSVLDALVSTMLSQNTTDTTSARAYANLKAVCPTWEACRVANVSIVEEAIHCCGLSQIRATRIQAILEDVNKTLKKGEELDSGLEHLRDCTDQEAKAALCKFNGVGPKTAACVLMFALQRPEFPVDTHVWRICKALKWCPPKANREDCYLHMNARVPNDLKFDLHVLLVEHGKRCVSCAANGKPRKEVLGPCPLFGKGKLAAAAPGEEEEEVGKGGVKSEKGTGKAKGVKAEKVAKGVKSEKKGVVKAEEVKHEHDLHYGLVKFEEPVQEEDAVKEEDAVSSEEPGKGEAAKSKRARIPKKGAPKEEVVDTPEANSGKRVRVKVEKADVEQTGSTVKRRKA